MKRGFEVHWFTFFDHPHCEALLEATILASVPPAFVHRAAFGGQTHIFGIFLDCALRGERKKDLDILNLALRLISFHSSGLFNTIKNVCF